jgi:hypothetical protein
MFFYKFLYNRYMKIFLGLIIFYACSIKNNNSSNMMISEEETESYSPATSTQHHSPDLQTKEENNIYNNVKDDHFIFIKKFYEILFFGKKKPTENEVEKNLTTYLNSFLKEEEITKKDFLYDDNYIIRFIYSFIEKKLDKITLKGEKRKYNLIYLFILYIPSFVDILDDKWTDIFSIENEQKLDTLYNFINLFFDLDKFSELIDKKEEKSQYKNSLKILETVNKKNTFFSSAKKPGVITYFASSSYKEKFYLKDEFDDTTLKEIAEKYIRITFEFFQKFVIPSLDKNSELKNEIIRTILETIFFSCSDVYIIRNFELLLLENNNKFIVPQKSLFRKKIQRLVNLTQESKIIEPISKIEEEKNITSNTNIKNPEHKSQSNLIETQNKSKKEESISIKNIENIPTDEKSIENIIEIIKEIYNQYIDKNNEKLNHIKYKDPNFDYKIFVPSNICIDDIEKFIAIWIVHLNNLGGIEFLIKILSNTNFKTLIEKISEESKKKFVNNSIVPIGERKNPNTKFFGRYGTNTTNDVTVHIVSINPYNNEEYDLHNKYSKFDLEDFKKYILEKIENLKEQLSLLKEKDAEDLSKLIQYIEKNSEDEGRFEDLTEDTNKEYMRVLIELYQLLVYIFEDKILDKILENLIPQFKDKKTLVMYSFPNSGVFISKLKIGTQGEFDLKGLFFQILKKMIIKKKESNNNLIFIPGYFCYSCNNISNNVFLNDDDGFGISSEKELLNFLENFKQKIYQNSITSMMEFIEKDDFTSKEVIKAIDCLRNNSIEGYILEMVGDHNYTFSNNRESFTSESAIYHTNSYEKEALFLTLLMLFYINTDLEKLLEFLKLLGSSNDDKIKKEDYDFYEKINEKIKNEIEYSEKDSDEYDNICDKIKDAKENKIKKIGEFLKENVNFKKIHEAIFS